MINKLFKKVVFFIESQPLNFNGWVISFFTLLGLNLFFQYITYGFKSVTFEYFVGEIIQMYYFILYFVIVIFLYLITREDIKKVSAFVLWGFWSIIFWPVIDKIILRDDFYLSFYIFDSVLGVFYKMVTFFGEITPVGILYGTRIETIFIILLVCFYVYNKTSSLLRTFFGGVGVYILFYLSVALPSVLVFLVTILQGGNVMEIVNLDIVRFFNTPLSSFGLASRDFDVVFFYKLSLIYNLIFVGTLAFFQYLFNKKVLIAIIKNIRVPQIIFNWGLLFIGILIGLYYIPDNYTADFFSGIILMNLSLSVLFIWLFSVIINDIEDYDVDKISNKNRPLITGVISKELYNKYSYIFLFLSLLLAITINSTIFLIICLYALLTVIYSKQPFKLKRIPAIAGVVSGLASTLFFLIGFILVTGIQVREFFPWSVVIFLFFSYSLILPIKDLKDISSDEESGIKTIANLLGEKRARLYFGSVLFVLYSISVFVLNNGLFLVAVFFGAVSYWVVNNLKNQRNILLYKLLFLVILYLTITILR